jgi:hypothetical protein
LGPLTLSLPIASTVTVDTEDDWEQTPQEFRLSGPQQRLPAFPAYAITPSGPWAFALDVDEASLPEEAEVRWSADTGFPLDADSPAVRVSVPARAVQDWSVVETDRLTRVVPSFAEGRFRMVEHEVEGRFTLTPPLPDPETLPPRLSADTERIELVPYGNTLLRLTVFPVAQPR